MPDPETLPRLPRRLRSVHRAMTFQEFERMPRRLGWKHEYYGGKAHLTPSKLAVKLVLDLPVPVVCRDGVRRLRLGDVPALHTPFLEAFARTPDYAGYPPKSYRREASEYFERFLGDHRGDRSRASAVAEANGRYVGAALVKERASGHLLDCLLVRPRDQRCGWATALVSTAASWLHRKGVSRLQSYVHPANGASLQWHYRFGFRELPDLWVAVHRWRHYSDEIERLTRFEGMDLAGLEELRKLAQYWGSEADRLEKVEREDFWAAHPRFE
jgi:GNAT superfamily N-acetyltransferase